MKRTFAWLQAQRKLLLSAAFLSMQTATFAQVFNGATLPEYPYPVPGTLIPGPLPNPVNVTTHSFDYTFSHISYMTPAGFIPTPPCPPPCPAPPPPFNPWLSDLCIHTWDDVGSTAGLAWINRQTGSGIPGIIYDQGFMMYPAGVRNIEVSLQEDSTGYSMPMWGTAGAWYIVVSFYNSNPANYAGVGHYMEIWRWERPIPISTGGLTFINRIRLSALGAYTRISQDGHNGYGLVIAWSNPGPGPAAGINFVFGFTNVLFPNVSVSPVFVLGGTAGQNNVDVAFTHTGNGLNVQFVYDNIVGINGVITESQIPFQLGPPWVLPPAPAVNDVNVVPGPFPAGTFFKTRIDAPDHYGQDNWAYSYITPGIPPADIFVRFMNFNAPNFGVPVTYNLTNGSLGPLAIKQNDWPVLAFDANVAPSTINVGWYTRDQQNPFYLPNVGGYVDLQMDETGAVTSAFDYLQLGLGATASNLNASNTPTVAYSRQNDRTDYVYPVFANQLCPSTAAQMQTKEKPWTVGLFKGNPGSGNIWIDKIYGDKAHDPTSVTKLNGEEITAYPNPFGSKLTLSIPASLMEKDLAISVMDITGRVIEQFTDKGHAVNDRLLDIGSGLANGSYLVHINAPGINKSIKLEKMAVK